MLIVHLYYLCGCHRQQLINLCKTMFLLPSFNNSNKLGKLLCSVRVPSTQSVPEG